MKKLRNTVFVFIFLFMVIMGGGIVAGLRKMVEDGRISAHTMAAVMVVSLGVIILAMVIAIVVLTKRHREHLSQSSSKDILAEIIAIGEAEKARKAAEAGGNGERTEDESKES